MREVCAVVRYMCHRPSDTCACVKTDTSNRVYWREKAMARRESSPKLESQSPSFSPLDSARLSSTPLPHAILIVYQLCADDQERLDRPVSFASSFGCGGVKFLFLLWIPTSYSSYSACSCSCPCHCHPHWEARHKRAYSFAVPA